MPHLAAVDADSVHFCMDAHPKKMHLKIVLQGMTEIEIDMSPLTSPLFAIPKTGTGSAGGFRPFAGSKTDGSENPPRSGHARGLRFARVRPVISTGRHVGLCDVSW
jgi:hypothetical protein